MVENIASALVISPDGYDDQKMYLRSIIVSAHSGEKSLLVADARIVLGDWHDAWLLELPTNMTTVGMRSPALFVVAMSSRERDPHPHPIGNLPPRNLIALKIRRLEDVVVFAHITERDEELVISALRNRGVQGLPFHSISLPPTTCDEDGEGFLIVHTTH